MQLQKMKKYSTGLLLHSLANRIEEIFPIKNIKEDPRKKFCQASILRIVFSDLEKLWDNLFIKGSSQ